MAVRVRAWAAWAGVCCECQNQEQICQAANNMNVHAWIAGIPLASLFKRITFLVRRTELLHTPIMCGCTLGITTCLSPPLVSTIAPYSPVSQPPPEIISQHQENQKEIATLKCQTNGTTSVSWGQRIMVHKNYSQDMRAG